MPDFVVLYTDDTLARLEYDIRLHLSSREGSSEDMADFETVALVGDVPEGQGRVFVVQGRLVAVFLRGGEYFAINDTCPHMGASLAEGYLEGDAVMCPWHAWKFCIKDGLWLDNPKSNIRTDSYPIRVIGDAIQVQIPDPPVKTT